MQLAENSSLQSEARADRAEETCNQWKHKFDQVAQELQECRNVILLYEGIVHKLTEQNERLELQRVFYSEKHSSRKTQVDTIELSS